MPPGLKKKTEYNQGKEKKNFFNSLTSSGRAEAALGGTSILASTVVDLSAHTQNFHLPEFYFTGSL